MIKFVELGIASLLVPSTNVLDRLGFLLWKVTYSTLPAVPIPISIWKPRGFRESRLLCSAKVCLQSVRRKIVSELKTKKEKGNSYNVRKKVKKAETGACGTGAFSARKC